ncbi:hypothetical protein [Spirosoma sordidisoli]|uniref:Uncharacterized protein n=1 Tax=Spirosoma sordidisoli TaxID=2502893 RepID=A0A4V1RWB0_9BACT|nr:hypothetical protein [Spirosoma sordidisoli]RYC69638.1 hypothetical protein EQG79_13640 [Spirosoma sordidisoli]
MTATASTLSQTPEDFFSNDLPAEAPATPGGQAAPASPAPAPATPPAAPAAPATPTTTLPAPATPPADPAQPATPPADGWGDEWEDPAAPAAPAAPATPTTTPPAPVDANPVLSRLAQRLGLNELPADPEAWERAVDQYTASQVQVMPDELGQLNSHLALTGKDFLRAEIAARFRDPVVNGPDFVENKLLELEDSGRLEEAERYYRQERTQQRDQIVTQARQQQQQAEQQARQQIAAIEQHIDGAKSPDGQAYPQRVRDEIKRFIFSGELAQTLYGKENADALLDVALRYHPKLREQYTKRYEAALLKRGESSAYRSLENTTLNVGSGYGAPQQGSQIAKSDEDFFSNN